MTDKEKIENLESELDVLRDNNEHLIEQIQWLDLEIEELEDSNENHTYETLDLIHTIYEDLEEISTGWEFILWSYKYKNIIVTLK